MNKETNNSLSDAKATTAGGGTFIGIAGRIDTNKDSERLDWLIRQGPPGAAEGMGLNGEVWAIATVCADDSAATSDLLLVRSAIDAAMILGDAE